MGHFLNVSSPFERLPYVGRVCAGCGVEVITQNPTLVYCSRRCGGRVRWARFYARWGWRGRPAGPVEEER